MNNGKYHTESYITKQAKKTDRIFGVVKPHKRICEECENSFTWVGRKNTKAYKRAKFCCRSCANKQGPKKRQYKYNYRTLCWKYHKKECIICGENIVVEAHHYDNVHTNNHPTNFVPLCPTHHSYLKSHKGLYIIKECVDEYHTKFKGVWDCMGWSSALHAENQRGSIPRHSTRGKHL